MDVLDKAVSIIREGGIVAFPTETVYGIGANAFNDEACKKIFKIKGRPSTNPLIVHVSSKRAAEELCIFNEDAKILADNLWPGPLTLVLPIKYPSKIAPTVLAGNATIAIRVPAGAIIKELIETLRLPIAAPSANPSGYISSTASAHVVAHFDDLLVLTENGLKPCGLESTILDLSVESPNILRYGFITPYAIEKLIGKSIIKAPINSIIKAPGMLLKHYAPNTKVRLNAKSAANNEVSLDFGNSNIKSVKSLNLSPKGDLIEAAANLYKMLIELDIFAKNHNIATIAIAEVPNVGIGLAINDRLARAAF